MWMDIHILEGQMPLRYELFPAFVFQLGGTVTERYTSRLRLGNLGGSRRILSAVVSFGISKAPSS